ncbi:MAG: amidohydrolase family protein [Proteobacteria bacterium]|nr:amidohydrolase family protein [Pseudomonadota bacterium]
MTLVIKGAHIVTGDAADSRHDKADIVVEADRIAAIGPAAGRAAIAGSAEVIDGAALIAMPGFVNAHIHSSEAFQQAVYKNAPLEPWLLEAHSPFGARLPTSREHYLTSMLSGILAIRGGATTVQDDFIHIAATTDAQDHSIQAYYDLGIRAWSAVDMWDKPFSETLPYVEELFPPELKADFDALPIAGAEHWLNLFQAHFDKWHERDGLIRVHIAPCGPQRVTPELWREIDKLSAQHHIPLHSHCLETRLQAVESRWRHGKSFVEYLADLDMLSDRLTLVHAIWVTDRDIALMAEAGVSIIHNSLSNLKTGAGICPLRKYFDAGIAVGLGTDGVCTADGADMVEAIKATALMHTLGTLDYPNWIDAKDAFRLATTGGAATGLMSDQVGSLEVGKKADVILLDRNDWGFIPLSDPVHHLAYSVNSEVIRHSIINGKVVMRDRKITTIDEAAIRAEIRETAEKFLHEEVPAMRKGTAPYLPYMREMYLKAYNTPLDLPHYPRFPDAGS